MNNNLLYFFKSLQDFKGVGPKFNDGLVRLLGNARVFDLLFHFPTGVIDKTYSPSLLECEVGRVATLKVDVVQHIPVPFVKAKKVPYKIICANDTGNITLNFFQIYDSQKKMLEVGKKICVSGKVEKFGGELCISHPEIYPVEKFDEVCVKEPLYPLTYAITNKMIVNLVKQVLKELPDVQEWQEGATISFKDAIKVLHTDFSNQELREVARQRLVYDEILANQLYLTLLRNTYKTQKGFCVKNSGVYKNLVLKNLGYELTTAQKRVVSEIFADLESDYKMFRLLQGDVGSGKTIVAILALLNVVEVGGQGAFMVPTEILAEQHFKTLTEMVDKSGLSQKIRVVLLTGSDKSLIKKEKLKAIKNGEVDIVVGTHALFQNCVEFKNLMLAVIDEQHKFGVQQRLKLSNKGEHNKVNVLTMTATPIPRTLAMTSFGDMDLSVIDEMPPHRKIVETNLWSMAKIDKIFSLIDMRLSSGQIKKLYWVCPLVEESEKLDLTAVVQRFDDLKKYFGDKVALIHGKMKQEEKDSVMREFVNPDGKVKILLATTVIEVGVNVPEATLMIIEHSERFGLSSLHQLRGRIGRGGDKSTCLLLHSDKLTQQARARLTILKNTTDGFKIAEEDLKLRGAGDILGVKQSGQIDFKLADFMEDMDLFLASRSDVQNLMLKDSSLLSERGKNLRNLLFIFGYEKSVFDIYSA